MGGSKKCSSIGDGAPVSEATQARARRVAGTTRSEFMKRRQTQTLIFGPVAILWVRRAGERNEQRF